MPARDEKVPDIRIASPCKTSWEGMQGDDYVRFCGQCQLNVYNLSALSATEIREMVARKEGRLCVRLYRRADGTILTKDCPVGLAWLRKKIAVVAAACTAILFSAFGGIDFVGRLFGKRSCPSLPTQGWVAGDMVAPRDPPEMGKPMMGEAAVPEMGAPAPVSVEMGRR